MSYKDDTKLMNALEEYKIKCKCGHSINLFNSDRIVCSWCNKWVYRNPKVEFKYRLKTELRKVK